jgi:hypothetical protein
MPTAPDSWDRLAAWFIEHGAPYAVFAITLGVFLIHAHIFTGHTAGDDLSFHYAESARISDCLRDFDFDFWNPSANGGYASAYYYQVIPQLAAALPAAIFGRTCSRRSWRIAECGSSAPRPGKRRLPRSASRS